MTSKRSSLWSRAMQEKATIPGQEVSPDTKSSPEGPMGASQDSNKGGIDKKTVAGQKSGASTDKQTDDSVENKADKKEARLAEALRANLRRRKQPRAKP
ncbi:MAG: hypothetical protein AAFR21_11985 [Pseudomonadota bacterium]